MNLLKVKILDTCQNKEFVIDYYQQYQKNSAQHERDCGIDLIFPSEIYINNDQVVKCGLGIACEFIPQGQTESAGFYLVPRSSMANTPFMLANSIGIIDPTYRGEIIAALRSFNQGSYESTLIEKGAKLVQIISPDLKSIRVEVVEELSKTGRDDKGFGSTNI